LSHESNKKAKTRETKQKPMSWLCPEMVVKSLDQSEKARSRRETTVGIKDLCFESGVEERRSDA